MNKRDLESKIKSVGVPERAAEFWEKLPGRVLEQARALPAPERSAKLRRGGSLAAGFARFAVACLVAGFCLWQSGVPQSMSRNILKSEKALRQSLAQVPKHLETMMQDEHGLHNLVQDPP